MCPDGMRWKVRVGGAVFFRAVTGVLPQRRGSLRAGQRPAGGSSAVQCCPGPLASASLHLVPRRSPPSRPRPRPVPRTAWPLTESAFVPRRAACVGSQLQKTAASRSGRAGRPSGVRVRALLALSCLLPSLPWARLRPSAAFHPHAGLQGFLAARCGDSLGTSASANISRPPSPTGSRRFPLPSLMGSLLQCPFTASPPIPSSPPPCGLNPAHRSVATALPGTGDLQAGEAGVSAPTPGYSRPPQPAPGRCPLPRLLPCSGLTAGPP